MTIESNAHSTYDVVGMREDLSDAITNISPVDTIFYSGIGAGMKPKNTKVEWQTDSLASAASNAQLEGDATTTAAVTATTRIYNYCQIQKKTFRITGTTEEVSLAGRGSEVAYQTAKKMKELAKDIEYAFTQEVWATTEAGTEAIARKMKGCLNWITTNLDKAGDATLNADGTVTGGTARDLSEELLKTVLQGCFSSGGDPNMILAGPFQKRQIGAFTTNGTYRRNIQKAELVSTVDVYVSDFGTLEVVPHRNFPTDVVMVCDKQYWKKRTLRPTFRELLGKTGDSMGYHILVEHTLEAQAEAANGRITTLTTS